MKRTIAGLVNLAIGAWFTWVFYLRYWKYRDCIEAARSSCLTPEDDNLTQGGMIWAVPAVVFLLIGLALLIVAWRAHRRSRVDLASRNVGGTRH